MLPPFNDLWLLGKNPRKLMVHGGVNLSAPQMQWTLKCGMAVALQCTVPLQIYQSKSSVDLLRYDHFQQLSLSKEDVKVHLYFITRGCAKALSISG